MNPPFSATPGIERIRHDADLRHIRSAFSILPPGGRLAAVTSAHCVPGDATWRDAFADRAVRTVFTMAIDGRAYARRGTGFDTRLTVIERSAEPGIAVDGQTRAATPVELLDAVIAEVPPLLAIEPEPVRPAPAAVAGRDLFGNAVAPPKTTRKPAAASPKSAHDWGPVAAFAVETGSPDAGEVLSAPVRFRCGWMLGDGTDAGKGRQVAAIVLDNWLPGTGAATDLVETRRRDRLVPLTADAALDIGSREPGADGKPRLAVNARSKRAAVLLPAPSRMFDDGGVQERVRLVRPVTRETMARPELDASNWHRADEAQ